MIPVSKSVELKEILEKSGHEVSLEIYDSGHNIPVSYFEKIRLFLEL